MVIVVVEGVPVVVVDGPPQLVLQLAGQGHDVVHGGHQYVCLVNTDAIKISDLGEGLGRKKIE